MNTQMRGSVPEASGEASGPEGGDSNMGTVPTTGPVATSSQGTHSRGPWTFITIANDYGKVICHEEGIHDTVCVLDYDNAASNGRLIAAAPDLLATLEQIARLSREADRSRLDVATMLGEIASAAIAKVQS